MDTIILDLGTTIKGDSLVEGYVGKIDILSYSHNVDMQAVSAGLFVFRADILARFQNKECAWW